MANTRSYPKRKFFEEGGEVKRDPVTGRPLSGKGMGAPGGPDPVTGLTEGGWDPVTGKMGLKTTNPILPPGARNEPAPEQPVRLPRSGKGTARVDMKKYPGWPQMA